MAIDIEAPGIYQAELETALQALVFTDFANDPATTTGLTYGVKAGKILFDANADFNPYEAGTVTLFDDTQNALYLCPDLGGTIAEAVVVADSNLSEPFLPLGKWLLAFVTTAGGEITTITDKRGSIFAAFQSTGILTDLSFVKIEVDAPFTVTLKSGMIMTPTGPKSIISGRIINGVPDDATTYIEVDAAGTVSHNTTSFTDGRLPLCSVTMASGAVENVTDYRAFLSLYSGATGTFTTDDAKTVTVTNGIITAIT